MMPKMSSLGRPDLSNLVIQYRGMSKWHQVRIGSSVCPFNFGNVFGANMKTAFFISLAVQMKLHLNKPHKEGFDRQSLLDYYDQFPFLPQYFAIKPRHFNLKNLRSKVRLRTSKVALGLEKLEFGTLNDELDEKCMSDGSNGSNESKDGNNNLN